MAEFRWHLFPMEMPEEGERDRDQAQCMHEPRLVQVAQVLIYEPEHPAEEHEGDQLSQGINHGGNYSINRLLRELCESYLPEQPSYRYFTMHQIAFTPSFQPIFLPSA